MLEASGFDFRVRYPHKHLIKLAKEAKIAPDVTRVAYNIMLDIYRTFGPLKQSCATMAFACIELATLILEKQKGNIHGPRAPSYRKWCTSRVEVIETILDILDLYTHFQKSSAIGPIYDIQSFIQLKIKLNQEMDETAHLSRFTEEHEPPKTNGFKSHIKTPKTPITPASPSDTRVNGNAGASPATLSPRSSGSGRTKGMGARGQEGTIRFMLDAEKAKQEKATVDEYTKIEFEEYEVEVEEAIKPAERPQSHHIPQQRNGRGGYDDRFHNKRVRR
jgi:CTD kinase subunit beta